MEANIHRPSDLITFSPDWAKKGKKLCLASIYTVASSLLHTASLFLPWRAWLPHIPYPWESRQRNSSGPSSLQRYAQILPASLAQWCGLGIMGKVSVGMVHHQQSCSLPQNRGKCWRLAWPEPHRREQPSIMSIPGPDQPHLHCTGWLGCLYNFKSTPLVYKLSCIWLQYG